MTAIIGGFGFLGWHLACRLRAQGVEATRLGREDLVDPDRLESGLWLVPTSSTTSRESIAR